MFIFGKKSLIKFVLCFQNSKKVAGLLPDPTAPAIFQQLQTLAKQNPVCKLTLLLMQWPSREVPSNAPVFLFCSRSKSSKHYYDTNPEFISRGEAENVADASSRSVTAP